MAEQRKGNLSTQERNKVAQFLLQKSCNGKLNHGAQKEASTSFGITRKSVYKIWNIAKDQLASGNPVILLPRKQGNQHKDKIMLDVEKVRNLSVLQRSTIRKLAVHLNVSKSQVGNWIKEKQIRAHTSAIKPILTDINKLARLRWSLSHLNPKISNGNVKFMGMHNTIHIDEKWFYITKCSDKYYLLPDEEDLYRSCKSKRFITKVMFMCAVARPLYASDVDLIFDGKIGIFPFTTLEPAKRNSKNRLKGTMETKPIQAITKSVIKDCIIKQIIPAIKTKWPLSASKHIIIQQDNAKPHIDHNDEDFRAAANEDGFSIKLICQPPNSPNSNVNDLGFFRAIQSLQDDKYANGVDDLLRNVSSSFGELSAEKLNNIFLTLQRCYQEIMMVRGGNNYKIPHMNKAGLIMHGTLPENIYVEEGLVRDCLKYLMQPENNDGTSYNINPLVSSFGY